MMPQVKATRGKRRTNEWLAERLLELAARLELAGTPHAAGAYRRAAESIEHLPTSVARIRETAGPQGLEQLPGIGSHIANTLCELIDAGRSSRLDRLSRQIPVDVMQLLAIDGIGIKAVEALWKHLAVRNIDDLTKALDADRVCELPRFGKRRAARLREAVRAYRGGPRRMPLAWAREIAMRLREQIARHPAVVECVIAGSIRRGCELVGDIDLVAASGDPEAVAACLLELPEVGAVHLRGPRRVSVRLQSGIDVDMRVVPRESFGAALLYFTGSRQHTLGLRRLALAQGLRLNEYGLFSGRSCLAAATEEEVYAALSLPYIPPEARVGGGEIRAALRCNDRGAPAASVRDPAAGRSAVSRRR
jgi:DNA polymerase (family 10)